MIPIRITTTVDFEEENDLRRIKALLFPLFPRSFCWKHDIKKSFAGKNAVVSTQLAAFKGYG